MILLTTISLFALVYIYAGYPALLWLLVWIRGERAVHRQPITPSVSLVISAYNEADVIRQKLENALALDYPREQLQIVVISDASSDGTDGIVAAYADRGVELLRQPVRRGKTAGLNRTVPALRGEIIVFSDANAIYAADALRQLVRNFADPEVGCVTGEARYLEGSRSAADSGERAYWNYEIAVKRLETAVGSMVGGDGAIYGIRKSLWSTLPDNAINDFLNPLQIVAQGWRTIYEPGAVCYEETAGGVLREFRRRVRIVSRSWRAVFQARAVLNPFRIGFFAVSVASHKVLRWFSGLFVAGAVAGLLVGADPGWRAAGAYAGGFVVLLGVCAAVPSGRRVLAYAAYFGVISAASLVGIVKGTFGVAPAVWSTAREEVRTSHARPVKPSGALVLPLGAMLAVSLVLLLLVADLWNGRVLLFWSSVALLTYVYVGYPAVLSALRHIWRRPVAKQAIEPSVCLFITANDEAAVMETKLRNCLELDYPPHRLEILVASDGSVDRTNEIVRSFGGYGVRLLDFPGRRGKIAAINAGVADVRSEVIVFSDANVFLEPSAVRSLVRNLADPSVGAVSGDVVLVGDRAALGSSEDLYYRYERWLQRAESEIGSMIGVDGALYAVRRRLFAAPPDDTILDDVAIPLAVVRAGHRVVFEPEARGFEQGPQTAREEFWRKVRIVAGAVQLLARGRSLIPRTDGQVIFSLVSHKVLRWLAPAFAALAFAAALTLAGRSAIYLGVAVFQAAFIAAGLAGSHPRLRRVRPVSIAHYLCLVHLAAAVGLVRGLMGRQSVAWRRFARQTA